MLQIENLTKTYAGNQKPSVENLSLTVNDGEIFGFIGPNGAGKSTTIKSITGIISFEEGRVLIDGIDLKSAPLEAKKHIGYVSDDHVMYEGLTGKDRKDWQNTARFSLSKTRLRSRFPRIRTE